MRVWMKEEMNKRKNDEKGNEWKQKWMKEKVNERINECCECNKFWKSYKPEINGNANE